MEYGNLSLAIRCKANWFQRGECAFTNSNKVSSNNMCSQLIFMERTIFYSSMSKRRKTVMHTLVNNSLCSFKWGHLKHIIDNYVRCLCLSVCTLKSCCSPLFLLSKVFLSACPPEMWRFFSALHNFTSTLSIHEMVSGNAIWFIHHRHLSPICIYIFFRLMLVTF